MKTILTLSIIAIHLFFSTESTAQAKDTLIDIGTHKLNFKIYEGNGVPILFEAGGNSDLEVWNAILEPISDITNAPLIAYSREGYGKSTVDVINKNSESHTIENGIKSLTEGLKKLGFNDEIMLVSHSYGGYYSTLFSDRNPKKVKAVVLIDVNHNFIDNFIDELWVEWEPMLQTIKEQDIGLYYEGINIKKTIKTVKKASIPSSIPVIDIVSEATHFRKKERIEFWKQAHRDFVKNRPNTTEIIANNTNHMIWFDNPELVIMAIVKAYSSFQNEENKSHIEENAINFALEALNEQKKYEVTISVKVPNETDEVYITGNQDALAQWQPLRLLLRKTDSNTREIKLKINALAEFKFIMGNWDKEAIVNNYNPMNEVLPNIKINAEKSNKFEFKINSWQSVKK